MLTLDDIDLSSLKFPELGNHEFIVLYIAKNGAVRWKHLRDALMSWRGLKNPSRGHFAIYFAAPARRHRGYSGQFPTSSQLWWRRGGVYKLTDSGNARLPLIIAALEERMKGPKVKAKKKNRVPQKRIQLIRDTAILLGEAPRYTLATALKARMPDVSFNTVMDYVLSSVDEGILEKIGMNYRVKQ